MLRTFLLSRYFHGSHLDAPTVAGAIPLFPSDSRGLCGGVLGRNDNRQGDPTRLLLRAGRPLGRWACRIVERETRSRYRVLAHTLRGFAVCPTLRRLPLRAAMHMNATPRHLRDCRKTTYRISNSESWRDEGMARRYAIRPDRNASGSRLMVRSLPSACLRQKLGWQATNHAPSGIELFLFRR